MSKSCFDSTFSITSTPPTFLTYETSDLQITLTVDTNLESSLGATIVEVTETDNYTGKRAISIITILVAHNSEEAKELEEAV